MHKPPHAILPKLQGQAASPVYYRRRWTSTAVLEQGIGLAGGSRRRVVYWSHRSAGSASSHSKTTNDAKPLSLCPECYRLGLASYSSASDATTARRHFTRVIDAFKSCSFSILPQTIVSSLKHGGECRAQQHSHRVGLTCSVQSPVKRRRDQINGAAGPSSSNGQPAAAAGPAPRASGSSAPPSSLPPSSPPQPFSSDVENEISDIEGAVQDLDVGTDGEGDGDQEAESELGEDLFGEGMIK